MRVVGRWLEVRSEGERARELNVPGEDVLERVR